MGQMSRNHSFIEGGDWKRNFIRSKDRYQILNKNIQNQDKIWIAENKDKHCTLSKTPISFNAQKWTWEDSQAIITFLRTTGVCFK